MGPGRGGGVWDFEMLPVSGVDELTRFENKKERETRERRPGGERVLVLCDDKSVMKDVTRAGS